MPVRRKPVIVALIAGIVVLGIASRFWFSGSTGTGEVVVPAEAGEPDPSAGETRLTMGDVLDRAQAAREHMAATLEDYTARLVKQEPDKDGNLGEVSEMFLKVQTRLRNATDDAPMRVYLKFNSPESKAGREVIWGEDLYDGQLAVYEKAFLLNLKTIWLNPTSFLAMQGEQYPISEIGLVRLVEQLIERGEVDRDDPHITVNVIEDFKIGEIPAELIQVRRSQPNGREDDFSLAEIGIDPERQIILSYRSFGWPKQEGQSPPLLESYQYLDVQTNVGLTEKDFDPSTYDFP